MSGPLERALVLLAQVYSAAGRLGTAARRNNAAGVTQCRKRWELALRMADPICWRLRDITDEVIDLRPRIRLIQWC
jgi:hypothetical protein